MLPMRIALIAALIAQLTPSPANRHATVTAVAADVGGKPGGKLALYVDITPKPGIHIPTRAETAMLTRANVRRFVDGERVSGVSPLIEYRAQLAYTAILRPRQRRGR